ncbi:cell adhesion molecule CEACAM3-like [Ascaphus truei]|uniref:cell adhesion molecule CEACAM3-like n=1 Tax=Ascaphus truei TaxID=8439 RepID=UPI003F5A4E38
MLGRRDTPPLDTRLRVCVLAVLLSLWMEVTSGFVIQRIPESPAVGQNVTLKVTGVTETIQGFSWYKGSGTDSQNQILFYSPNINTLVPGAQYFSRASPLPDGSLQISDLVTSDRGNYTAQIQANTQLQYTVSLPVYDPSAAAAPSAGVIAGAVCGTIIGVIVIAAASVLLYKQYGTPGRRGQGDIWDPGEKRSGGYMGPRGEETLWSWVMDHKPSTYQEAATMAEEYVTTRPHYRKRVLNPIQVSAA